MKIVPTNGQTILADTGVNSLPDSPAQQGLNAKQVKSALDRPLRLLLSWLNALDDKVEYANLIPHVFDELPSTELYEEDGTLVFVASDGELTAYLLNEGEWERVGYPLAQTKTLIDALASYFTDGKANRAIADGNGDNIASTYAKDASVVHNAGNETVNGLKTFSNGAIFQQAIVSAGFHLASGRMHADSKTVWKIVLGPASGYFTTYVMPFDYQDGDQHKEATYTLATTGQVASAKQEAINTANSSAQQKVNDLATAMDFSNGTFGTITAGELNVTKMNVVNTETKSASVEDQFLEMLKGNTLAYGSNYVGFVFSKYDATNDFFMGIYNDTLMIGDCTATRVDGKITAITPISLEPIMARADTAEITDGNLLEWDATNHRAKDASISGSGLAGAEAIRVSNENDRVSAEADRAAEFAEWRSHTSGFLTAQGYYPLLKAGVADVADNLTTPDGVQATTSFVFESSGGESDLATGLQKLVALRGNTVVFNQLYSPSYIGFGSYDSTTGVYSATGTPDADYFVTSVSAKYVAGHKYLIRGYANSDMASHMAYFPSDNTPFMDNVISLLDGDFITTAIKDISAVMVIRLKAGVATDFSFIPQIFDLTAMFGAGNEPTTVLKFNRLFPQAFYAYNTGELLSCQSSKFTAIGFNAFDGELEQGGIDQDGEEESSAATVRSKNYVRVVAGQTYNVETPNAGSFTDCGVCFYDGDKNYLGRVYETYVASTPIEATTPDNCHFVRLYFCNAEGLVPSDITNLCLHLKWSGGKTGYEDYVKREYELPNITLRSIGSLADELSPNGTLVRKVEATDLGDLNWSYSDGSDPYFYSSDLSSSAKLNGATLCAQYQTSKNVAVDDNVFIDTLTSNLICVDHDYTDPTAFKAAVKGTVVLYELETPSVKQTGYVFTDQPYVDDYGTLEFDSDVPQGNLILYMTNLKDFLRRVGNRVDIGYDPAQIASKGDLNTINLSDYATKATVGLPVISAPSSTTLTDEEKAAIIGGCCIDGTFLGLKNPIFLPADDVGSSGNYQGVVYGMDHYISPKLVMYRITGSTNAIVKFENIRVEFNSVTDEVKIPYLNASDRVKILGKQLPAYQSDTTKKYLYVQNTSGNLEWEDGSTYVDTTSAQTITGIKTLKDLLIFQKGSWSKSIFDNNDLYGLVLRNDNGGVSIRAPYLLPFGNSVNLGTSVYKWKDIYLSGVLSDGTNSVSVADLKALIDYAKAQGWIS